MSGERKYYTLLLRETGGKWGPQFGDWDRAVVQEESNTVYGDRNSSGYYPKKNRKIITTNGSTKAIGEAIAALHMAEWYPEG